MKLQVNDSGSWRDMLKNVPDDRLKAIMLSGTILMRGLRDTHIKLRLLDGDAVYGYCEPPRYSWRLSK